MISGSQFEDFARRAKEMDAADPLARFRSEFRLGPAGEIDLVANSLGRCSTRVERAVARTLAIWGSYGLDGWLREPNPWFTMAERVGGMLGQLVSAQPGSVVASNSTTVNLHQLLATFYHPRPGRSAILGDALTFPSDVFALRSHLRVRGVDPEANLALLDGDGWTLDESQIIERMSRGDVALAVLPTVVYRSGQLLDIRRVSRAARELGVTLAWDASHSVGVVPHEFDAWGVDLAFWCNYKYICGGPGAVAAIYVNRRHFGADPGLAGWFSGEKSSMFNGQTTLTPAPDAGAMQVGTPPILGLAPVEAACELILEAGIEALRAKSLEMTGFLLELVDRAFVGEFTVANPRQSERRGGHIALRHPDARRISQALRLRGVMGDFREPDLMRFAPSPLHGRFADCLEAVVRLADVLENAETLAVEPTRQPVP